MSANKLTHVYIDSNVLIDFVEHQYFLESLSNKTLAINAYKALDFLFQQRRVMLFVSSASILQLISNFQSKRRKPRPLTTEEVIDATTRFLGKCEIVGLTENDIENGMGLDGEDLEDNIQYTLSQKVKCFYIVTSDKGFKEFANVDIVKPDKIRRILF